MSERIPCPCGARLDDGYCVDGCPGRVVAVDDIPLADLKSAFARSDLSLDPTEES